MKASPRYTAASAWSAAGYVGVGFLSNPSSRGRFIEFIEFIELLVYCDDDPSHFGWGDS